MIMLRERRTTGTTRTSDGDCDCGILSDVLDGLNKVVADDAVVAAGEQADGKFIFASHVNRREIFPIRNLAGQ